MAHRRDHPPPRHDHDPGGGLRFFFVFLFRLSLNGFASVLNTYAGQRIVFTIRLELLRHLERLSSSFHRKTAPGELLHRIENDVQVVEELGGTLLMSVVRIAVTSVLTVAVMLLLDWKLTLLAMPLLAVTFWIRRYGQPRLRTISDEVQKAGAERMAFLQELFTSILQVQLLRRETAEARRFVALSRRNLDLQVRRRGGELLLGMACILAMAAGTAVVLGFGGYQVVAGVLTIGGLVAFYTFLSRLFEPIENITAMYSQYQRAAASVRRVQQLLDLAPSIRDAPHALPLRSDTRGAVELRGVTFRYENQRPILRAVDLRVEPGERLAVIGPTGSGKSTLAGLLTRAYDPDEGEVRIGGVDLRRVRVRDVRAAVAVVPQEPLLFDTTLRENLKYGNRHATARDIDEALHLAQLDEMVRRLPDGIDQRIGPRGGLLSGGERQRVAIARAILQRPAVLVLDEATSALDGPTEKRLLAALGTFTRDRTTIVIAHRLAPILWADRALFLDDGAVVAAGPHRELHLSCVRYRNFLDDQLRREGTEEAA